MTVNRALWFCCSKEGAIETGILHLRKAAQARKLPNSESYGCVRKNEMINDRLNFSWFSVACVMIFKISRRYLYYVVRSEILGSIKDLQLQRQRPRIYFLMKNVSWEIEDDQIPSLSQL